jgi:hypothetical protein
MLILPWFETMVVRDSVFWEEDDCSNFVRLRKQPSGEECFVLREDDIVVQIFLRHRLSLNSNAMRETVLCGRAWNG